MTNLRKTVRFFTVLIVVEIALIAALLIAFAVRADAHQPKLAGCDLAWEQAPPGEKWRAKQRCLAYVENHVCRAHPRVVPSDVRVKGKRVGMNQRHVLGWIVSEGLRRRLSYKVVHSAIAATTQEASARELTYGEGTSLGPFQLIDDHGSAADRITVEYSGDWYFNGALKVVRRNPGILVDDLAQAVESSGHPDAYEEWVPESARTLDSILGACQLR